VVVEGKTILMTTTQKFSLVLLALPLNGKKTHLGGALWVSCERDGAFTLWAGGVGLVTTRKVEDTAELAEDYLLGLWA
jgi:hypothetical protein